MTKLNSHIDWFLLLAVAALMFFSLAFVYTAGAYTADIRFGGAEKFFINHLARVLIGFAIIFIFTILPYRIWMKFSRFIIIISIFTLILLIFSGINVKGATRWLSLGAFTFQPSEFAKFALILHFSTLLHKKQEVIKDLYMGFLPFVLWGGGICFLIALQPNFSTMMVVFAIAFIMMFIGNANVIHLGSTFIVGLVGATLYAVSADYRLNRIMAFLGASSDSANQTVNYQLNQSLLALGNGGIFGTGIGRNRQSYFLPESYGDFIFSIIGEEYGFVGLFVIIALFGVILWRGIVIARNSPDSFSYFLAMGIVTSITLYFLVNAGVNTGLLPTTGVPMPFISYGGTAILIYSAMIGILLNISRYSGIYAKNQEPEDEPIEASEL